MSAQPPPASADTIRCMVVDDHAAVRAGVGGLLSLHPRLEMVASCGSAERALTVAERDRVDVAIVDYQMPGRSGLWLSRRLKRLSNAPAVVIYSAFSDDLLAAACVIAEADAMVSKGALGEELAEVVHAVLAGERRLPAPSPVMAGSILGQMDPGDQAIYGMMAMGVETVEVARTLRISETEVDARLWEMLRTLERAGTRG